MKKQHYILILLFILTSGIVIWSKTTQNINSNYQSTRDILEEATTEIGNSLNDIILENNDQYVYTQKYLQEESVIEFYKDNLLINSFDIEANKPNYDNISHHTSLTTPNKILYNHKYIAVSYIGNNDLNIITTIILIDLQGDIQKNVEFPKKYFIPKSVSPDSNIVFGLSFNEGNIEEDPFLPELINLSTKVELWKSLNLLELSNTEYTHGAFLVNGNLVFMREGGVDDNIFLLDFKENKVNWKSIIELNNQRLILDYNTISISNKNSGKTTFSKSFQ